MFCGVAYCYLLGMVISGVFIFRQRRKLHRQINSMEQWAIGKKVYISEMPVTPFTIGVFHSKVVVPKVMKDTFEAEELQAVLLHEKTHIRLGHLWFYLLWDVLCMVLWLNPLLTYCMGYLKEDMEDICDRVTIQKGGGNSYEYGQLLLKSIKLLKAENMGISATFVGEKDYQDLKRRVIKVAGYKPYWKIGVTILCVACLHFRMFLGRTGYMKIWTVFGLGLEPIPNCRELGILQMGYMWIIAGPKRS